MPLPSNRNMQIKPWAGQLFNSSCAICSIFQHCNRVLPLFVCNKISAIYFGLSGEHKKTTVVCVLIWDSVLKVSYHSCKPQLRWVRPRLRTDRHCAIFDFPPLQGRAFGCRAGGEWAAAPACLHHPPLATTHLERPHFTDHMQISTDEEVGFPTRPFRRRFFFFLPSVHLSPGERLLQTIKGLPSEGKHRLILQ